MPSRVMLVRYGLEFILLGVAVVSGAAFFSSITIVVPTYREAKNLPHLFDRIATVRQAEGLDLEVIVMDDDSRDGSDSVVASRDEDWIRLVTRTADRGLSPSVLDGLRRAVTHQRRRDEGVAVVLQRAPFH